MARSRSTRTRTRWLAAAVVLAVALAVGGPYVYINLVQGDTPDRLYAATEQAAADTTIGGANGELTLHGTTKAVTVQVTVKRSGDGFSVSGSVPVTWPLASVLARTVTRKSSCGKTWPGCAAADCSALSSSTPTWPRSSATRPQRTSTMSGTALSQASSTRSLRRYLVSRAGHENRS